MIEESYLGTTHVIMSVADAELEASQAPAPPDLETSRKSAWTGMKRFLTRGNARWQVLGAVLLVGAIIAVVTTNPAAVNGLRQNLLLKNNQGNSQGEGHKIRAELSGMDPMHHYWDDVRGEKSNSLACKSGLQGARVRT